MDTRDAQFLLQIAAPHDGPKRNGDRLHQACTWKKYSWKAKESFLNGEPEWLSYEFRSTMFESSSSTKGTGKFAIELAECRKGFYEFLDAKIEGAILKAVPLPQEQTPTERNLEQAQAMNALIRPYRSPREGVWKTIIAGGSVYQFPCEAITLHFSLPPKDEGNALELTAYFPELFHGKSLPIGKYEVVVDDASLCFRFTSWFAIEANLPSETKVFRLPFETFLPDEAAAQSPEDEAVKSCDNSEGEEFWARRPLNRLYSKWRKG